MSCRFSFVLSRFLSLRSVPCRSDPFDHPAHKVSLAWVVSQGSCARYHKFVGLLSSKAAEGDDFIAAPRGASAALAISTRIKRARKRLQKCDTRDSSARYERGRLYVHLFAVERGGRLVALDPPSGPARRAARFSWPRLLEQAAGCWPSANSRQHPYSSEWGQFSLPIRLPDERRRATRAPPGLVRLFVARIFSRADLRRRRAARYRRAAIQSLSLPAARERCARIQRFHRPTNSSHAN